MEYVNLNRDLKKMAEMLTLTFLLYKIYIVFFFLFKAHVILLWSFAYQC